MSQQKRVHKQVRHALKILIRFFFFVNKTAAGFYKGLSPAKKLRNFT